MNTITSFLGPSRKRIRLSCFCCLLLLLCIFTALQLPSGEDSLPPDVGDLAPARRRMIEHDIRGRGISNERVLEIMSALPRHLFVPENLSARAYEDKPLPIGAGQTISQPYVVALMTQLLNLKGTERVLEIGTGSGYQTAVLAGLAGEVYSVEIVESLAIQAEKILTGMGFGNIRLKVGDGFHGWEEYSPFDAILVTAAAPEIPKSLWKQLREGGPLVMPMGHPGQTQRLVRARKEAGRTVIEDLSAVLFVPLKRETQKAQR